MIELTKELNGRILDNGGGEGIIGKHPDAVEGVKKELSRNE